MTPDALRSSFLEFFRTQDHTVVRSSPVVPEGDPTLLFTNAGMNQFKDVLLGLEKRDYQRAASVQKCIRAGGKHNDLDEVGKDGRHLTFFEMLGNWSFGDYYKREAIAWAWAYVTDGLGLPAARLRVSVYKDDDEAWHIWHDEIGVPAEHIIRLGDIEQDDEENFWSMGPTGPCGPCTEIYFDQYADTRPPAPWAPGFDEERFLEIWNLVFMEFDRDSSGALSPLPLKSVDTGMGLERVAAILEGVDSVFETALFRPIIAHTHALLHDGEPGDPLAVLRSEEGTAYCVIADHIRSLAFCVSEGATFSNEGRGYVLRRILRRAVRFGRTLGFDAPFLWRVAEAVVDTFGEAWPELRLKQREAAEVIRQEEERFFRTLDRGIDLFEEVARETRAAGADTIDGESVFRLYDTFGFPPDLTRIMAEEKGLHIDEAGYENAMQAQRDRSRVADDRYAGAGEWNILREGAADRFVGYHETETDTRVLRYRISDDGVVELTLEASPFYPEAGGQVGDHGTLHTADDTVVLHVHDTRRTTAGITHFATVRAGEPSPEALSGTVRACVDVRRRFLTACNHTATHLLHAALHRFVSPTAFQSGSLVAPDRLRFDFSHGQPVTPDQLDAIETWVNERIQEAHDVHIHDDVALADAEARGAMMIFGEKYGERVRVVEVPGQSTELCGGIHVASTRDIAWFRIVSETGVAAGVRRIEALTNAGAFARASEQRALLQQIQGTLRVPETTLMQRIEGLLAERAELERRVEALNARVAAQTASTMLEDAPTIDGVTVLARKVAVPDRDALLGMADALRPRMSGPTAVLLAAIIEDKPALLVALSDDAMGRGLHAGRLINTVAAHVGGKGGGRPNLAQAGGRDAAGLPQAIEAFSAAVSAMLGASTQAS